MTRINLREYYPFYKSDCFIDVPDEVAALLLAHARYEAAYQRRTYRHRAHFSLDRDDGIEHDILFVSLSPCEIYERKVTNEQLHTAIASLPDKQAKRIYAHYFLGMSKAAIAKAEGVHESTVREAIDIEIDALPLKSHMRDKAEREEQRLLYVGMTRAKDGLVLAMRKSSDGSSLKSAWLDILKDARGEQIVKMSTDIGDRSIQIGKAQIPFDIYGYGVENAGLPGLTSDDSEFLPSFPDIQKEYPNARVSPSELPYDPDDAGEDELKTVEVFGQRIKIIGSPEMDVLGSAVHSYFAVDYECLAADNQTNLARNIIKNWSMESSIDPTDLVDAGQRFAAFIDRSYEGYKAYKEWPISMRNEEGQIVQGWIDLLLDTPAGYVIIDHKDYPGKDVLDRMKKYVPQLRTYKEIVEKATGRPVIDMLLHLPISGLILRLLP